MIAITEEFKKALIEEINKDAAFGYELFSAIFESAGDQIVTNTYLDQALVRQTKEFDEKLAKQSREFTAKLEEQSREFTAKLEEQSREFTQKLEQLSEQFDEKLVRLGERLSEQFDEKLARQGEQFDLKLERRLTEQTEEIKRFIDSKLGRIGSRWGEKVEENYHRFAEEVVAQWGGTVTKWRRSVTMTDEYGRVYKQPYEIDIVVANGTLMLVEMKASCDLDDVEHFLDIVEQYEYLEKPTKPLKRCIVTFDLSEPALMKAEETHITIIMPD